MKGYLVALLLIQSLVFIAMILDIPVLRQVACFVYLTFIPGSLILKLIGMNDGSRLESLLFSVGLSIAFLMFIGLLLNTVYPVLGIPKPLSAFPLIASICVIVLALYVFVFFRGKRLSRSIVSSFKFSSAVPLLISIPIITIIGTELARCYASNYVLLFLAVLVSIIVLSTFWKRLIPSEAFVLVVFVISFFLLFHMTLASNYLMGADIHMEYYFAKLTSVNSLWNVAISHQYNAMLSVTILPVTYSLFLNVGIDWVFKIVFPLIYSLMPLALYLVYKKQTSSLIAFLSVFFFMSVETFYVQMLGLAREMIAELFFVLLMFLMVEGKLSVSKKKLLFLVFGAALVVSHYALSYIFMFCLLFVPLLSPLLKNSSIRSNRAVSATTILLYSAITLSWNLYVSTAAFSSLTNIVSYIYSQLVEHVPGPGVTSFVPPFTSLVHEAQKYMFYTLQVFIVVGIVMLVVRYRKKLSPEYSSMSIANVLILMMCLFVPSFAAGLVVSRFYHIVLFFLAPFCVLGGVAVFGSITDIRSRLFSSKNRSGSGNKKFPLFLVSILLVFFFLFQIGFIYEVTRDIPSSISLSRNHMDKWTTYMNDLYIDDEEITCTKWLSGHANNMSKVYADVGIGFLTSYGFVPPERLKTYTEFPPKSRGVSYFYFGGLNVIKGIIESPDIFWNVSDFSDFFSNTSKIYSNGASDVYFGHS